MNFTESEGVTFWPVYKEYASAQQVIAAKRWNMVVDYAQNIDKMDDQKPKTSANACSRLTTRYRVCGKRIIPVLKRPWERSAPQSSTKWITV
jgi:hypothetical protein